jgi:HSP20 family molecular chaperone IbpA
MERTLGRHGRAVERVALAGILVLQIAILWQLRVRESETPEPGPPSRKPSTDADGTAAFRGLRQETPEPAGRWPRRGVARLDTTPGINPGLREAVRFQDRMNRMFEQALTDMERMGGLWDLDGGWDALMASPAMDMREHEDSYIVVVSVPGIGASDVSVTLEGRLLTVAAMIGHRNSPGFHRYERKVRLPGPVAGGSEARAALTNGVLRIVIPKGPDESVSGKRNRLF